MESNNLNTSDNPQPHGSNAHLPNQGDSNCALPNHYGYNVGGNSVSTAYRAVPIPGISDNSAELKNDGYPYNYSNYNYENDAVNVSGAPPTNSNYYDTSLYYNMGYGYPSAPSSYYHPQPPPPSINNSFIQGVAANTVPASLNPVNPSSISGSPSGGRIPYANRHMMSFPSLVERHKYHLHRPDPSCKLCIKHRAEHSNVPLTNVFVHPHTVGTSFNRCVRANASFSEVHNNSSDMEGGGTSNRDAIKEDDSDEGGSSLEMINTSTYNINTLLRSNILSSEYFRSLNLLKNYKEILEEIYSYVNHVEPYCGSGSRAPSTIFCCLYKLLTMHLSEKQLKTLIECKDSCYIKACGFLYLRYVHNPAGLWQWFEPYLLDEEEFTVSADKRKKMTMGAYVQSLLVEDKYFSTVLPRLPIKLKNLYGARLMIIDEHRRRLKENREILPRFVKGESAMAYINGEWRKGEISGTVNQGKDKVLVKFRRIDGMEKMVNLGYVKLELKQLNKSSSAENTEKEATSIIRSSSRSRSRSIQTRSERKKRKRTSSLSKHRSLSRSSSRSCIGSSGYQRNRHRRSSNRYRDSSSEKRRHVSRERTEHKNRDKNRVRERNKIRSRGGSTHRSKDRSRDRIRCRSRDRSTDRNRNKSKDSSRERKREKYRRKHREHSREKHRERHVDHEHHRDKYFIERDRSSNHKRDSYDGSSRTKRESSSSRRNNTKEREKTKREADKREEELINKFRKLEREKAVTMGKDYAKRPTSYKSSLSVKVSNLAVRKRSVSRSRSLDGAKCKSDTKKYTKAEDAKVSTNVQKEKLQKLMERYNVKDPNESNEMSSTEYNNEKLIDTEEPEIMKLG